MEEEQTFPDSTMNMEELLFRQPLINIVITNQPVIARGDCTFEELESIHKKMETELGKKVPL